MEVIPKGTIIGLGRKPGNNNSPPFSKSHQAVQDPGIKKTGFTCRVCNGPIMSEQHLEQAPQTGPKVYGPGNGRSSLVMGAIVYYCDECGLLYHKLPKGKSDAEVSDQQQPSKDKNEKAT